MGILFGGGGLYLATVGRYYCCEHVRRAYEELCVIAS
jgi:hypothetical protein